MPLEINFIPDHRILHEAGFNVLAYDLRSHGHSGEGNVGSLKYARDRRDTRDMAVGPFGRCLGGHPAAFAAYEKRRGARAERVVAYSRTISDGKAAGPVARVFRDLMMPVFLCRAASAEGLAWMYRHHIDRDRPVAA
ncbi:hypothetical protein [Spongiactinospora sp. 9N601]|uniref:hypothetical protein n=1 Tax=Spongiactinospora sp. 9N601 TaxID=3375149 RepID=UPI00379EDAEB